MTGADGGSEAGWTFVFDDEDPEQEGLREALCTLGNGYFATRGAAPEYDADAHHYPGCYLAGGYDRLTTRIDGHEVENEDLVNLPNWLPVRLRIGDGPWIRPDRAEVLTSRRELGLRSGVLRREVRFRDAEGRTTSWRERRLVSMASPHLAALSVELVAEDWEGPATVVSAIDGGVENAGVPRYRALASRHLETTGTRRLGEDSMLLESTTVQSRLRIALAVRTRAHRAGSDATLVRRTVEAPDRVEQELEVEFRTGQPITVEKVLALYTSRDRAISEPGIEAAAAVSQAGGFDELLAPHRIAWSALWESCDIELSEHRSPGTDLKLRVYLFHLLQTTSEHSIDLDVGIPARGWHGEAYRGHIFWDELFVFPFFLLRMPIVARAVLMYRYRRGAMFPWQSGSNGREESQRVHLNPRSGRWIPDDTYRQRHVSAAIAYNVWQYYQVSEDHEFLDHYGAEMLVEIARFWASVARYDPEIDRYRIAGVVGPDEYHTALPDAEPGLTDNAYTNVLVSWTLTRAVEALELLPDNRRRALALRLGLVDEETEQWREVARKLRVPFHDGIIDQFDGYADLAELDWEGYRRRYGDIQRIDRILEAEGDSTNRYKVSKQADVLMLFYLFSAEELAELFEQLGYPFDPGIIPRTVEYYLARTTHGSTLSRIAHSWVLARSDRPRSWELFEGALESDISDIQGGTTPEGIHVGAMAGTVDLIQRCYLGVEIRADVLHLDPALPDELGGVRVRLSYRRQVLDIEADHDTLRVASLPLSAEPIVVAYRGRARQVFAGDGFEFRLLRPEERDRDENRARDGGGLGLSDAGPVDQGPG